MKRPSVLCSVHYTFACLLLFLTTSTSSVLAQTLHIKGRVVDEGGNPVEGVTAKLSPTQKKSVSDSSGYVEFSGLEDREYAISIDHLAYHPFKLNVRPTASGAPRVDLKIMSRPVGSEDVLVTGDRGRLRASPTLRIDEPIINVAQNIQVVPAQLIERQQSFDMLEGITRNVSGVTRSEHWDNYALIYMRGSQAGAFRNGMNVSMPWGPLTEDMSMVERIEFVKGPAGFMLANGEPGGFYNVVTKKPTGQTGGTVDLSVGSFNTYRSTVDVQGSLSDDQRLLYRVNLMGQDRRSHVQFDYNDRYSIAPVVRYLLNDETVITAEYTYQYSEMLAPGTAYQFSARGFEDVPASWTMAEPWIDPTRINDHSVFLTLNHQLAQGWHLTTQLAYFDYEMIGSSLWPSSIDSAGNLRRGLGNWDAANESTLGQLFVNGYEKTGEIGHAILAGFDLGRKSYMADWNQYFILPGDFNIYDPKYAAVLDSLPQFDRSRSLRQRAAGYIDEQSYSSLYVQDELQFLDNQLRLTLAGRYTASSDNRGTKDEVVTPRAGISYSILPELSVYGLFDQAYVPQPGRDFDGNPFDPVTGNNIEAGVKTAFFDGLWVSSLTAYQITKNNVLTADVEHPDFSTQLGQTQSKGIEFDLNGRITESIDLMINYAYTDARITKDANAELIGNRTPATAVHITNGWLTYHIPSSRTSRFGVSLGYQWQIDRNSWYVFDGSEQPLPDYFRLDGGISWEGDRLNVMVNVNNILNKYLYSGGPYYGYYFWVSEAPRHVRATIGYKW